MNRFPHLTNNVPDYPGSGREVYTQIEGSFDQSEWREGTTITLMSVPWGVYDSETSNAVPGFETPETRDAWFNSAITGAGSGSVSEAHVLDTPVRYDMGATVDLPFTFDYASRYNYLIVDYGAAPVSYGDKGISKWYYHILDITYMSPSCTRVTLTPDWWTTFIPYIEISDVYLNRGHMPVAATSVRDYLANPIENCALLTTPDVDFGDGARMRVASFEDMLFNGSAVPVLALSGLRLDVDITDEPTDIPISVTQQGVNGAPAPIMYAMTAGDLFSFINMWSFKAPQTLTSLLGIYMIEESMLTYSGDAITLWGSTIRKVASGGRVQLSKTLTVDDFGYDERYQKYAKLYTYPYAHLELVGSDGSTVDVRVEDLYGDGPNLEVAFNAVFPYLTLDAQITNVGGESRTLVFGSMSRTMGGEWQKHTITLDVPIYGVYMDRKTLAEVEGYYSREQSKKNAQIAYENAMDKIEQTYANTNASIDTKLANGRLQNETAQENATASETTSYQNTVNYNATAYDNSEASATTSRDNAHRSADTGYSNTMLAASNTKTNSTLNATTSRDNSLLQNKTSYDTSLASADTSLANTKDSSTTSLANATATADANLTNTNASTDASLKATKDSNAATLANLARTQGTDTSMTTNNYDAQNQVISENYSRQTAMRERDQTISNYQTNLDHVNGTIDASASYKLAANLTDIEEAKGLQLISNSQALMQAQATSVLTTSNQTAAINAMGSMVKDISNFLLNPLSMVTSQSSTGGGAGNLISGIIGTTVDLAASQAVNNLTYQNQVQMNAAQAIKSTADLQASITASDEVNRQQTLFNTEKVANSFAFAHGLDNSVLGYYGYNWKEAMQDAYKGAGFAGISNASGIGYKTQWDLTHINYSMDMETTALGINRTNALNNLALSQATNTQNAQNSVDIMNSNAENATNVAKANSQRTRDVTVSTTTAATNTTNANADRTYKTTSDNLTASKTTSDKTTNDTYDTQVKVIDNIYTVEATNAAATRDTSKSNASDSFTTSIANATRSQTTADNAAKASYETKLATINRTKETADTTLNASVTTDRNNADRTKATDSAIAARNLQKELNNIDAGFKDSTVGAAELLGAQANCETATTRPLMLSVQVVTEDKGAIAQAAAAFLRYGYKLDQYVDFKTFNVMRYFSYWQCEDLFLTGIDEVPEKAQDVIRAMLYSGVTVWRDPNDIGKVSIYAN